MAGKGLRKLTWEQAMSVLKGLAGEITAHLTAYGSPANDPYDAGKPCEMDSKAYNRHLISNLNVSA